MSTTGWLRRQQVDLAAELAQRGCRRGRPPRRHALALEDERPHRLVDRGEVAVQELLGLVGLGRDPGTLAQLQDGLVRRRQVPARTRHDEALLLPHLRQRRRERLLDRAGQPADVLAVQRRDRGDRARVARGVAPALLDRRRADHDLVAQLGDRPVGPPGHEPPRAAPGACRFERERRLALVGDDDEQVGVAFRPQHELECLHGISPGHGRVERGAAAGEEEPRPVGEAPVGRHLGQPLRLGGDRPSRLLAVHEGYVYTIERGDGVPTRHARQRPPRRSRPTCRTRSRSPCW